MILPPHGRAQNSNARCHATARSAAREGSNWWSSRPSATIGPAHTVRFASPFPALPPRHLQAARAEPLPACLAAKSLKGADRSIQVRHEQPVTSSSLSHPPPCRAATTALVYTSPWSLALPPDGACGCAWRRWAHRSRVCGSPRGGIEGREVRWRHTPARLADWASGRPLSQLRCLRAKLKQWRVPLGVPAAVRQARARYV